MAVVLLESFDGEASLAQFKTNGKGWHSSSDMPMTASGRNGQGVGGATILSWRPGSGTACNIGSLGFAFRLANLSSQRSFLLVEASGGGGAGLYLRIKTDGTIAILRNSGGSVVATGTTVLATATWYYIEIQWSVNTNPGIYTLRINGVTELSGTANFSGNNVDQFSFFDADGVFRYDDVYFKNVAASSADFLGDTRIECLHPLANGTDTAWVPSTGTDHAALVDDGAGVDDTDYLTSSVDDDRDTWTYDDLVSTAGLVAAVQQVTRAAWTGSARNMQHSALLSATYSDSADVTLSNALTNYVRIMETDPGGGAWSISDVNSAEFGVQARP